MADLTPINLGPWSGIDNVHDLDAQVFQVAGENEARRPALVTASDVDLDNDGWSQMRGGVVQRVALTSGLSLFSGAGLLLVQDGGTIKLVDPDDWTTTDLVTGLAADQRVVFHEHADQIFWTNGISTGRILADGTTLNWGCTIPTPVLASVDSGSLRAGRYLVAATCVDGAGVEHGAGKSIIIILEADKNISVSFASLDASAVSVKLYVSKPNGLELFFVQQVAVGSLPAVISNVEVSEEQIRTQFLRPPFAADGLFSYRGLSMLFADEYVFPSYGVNAHLYEITTKIEKRPANIIAGAGLDNGFWTLTAGGVFWTSGTTPETWQTWQRSALAFAAGTLVLSGSLLPVLKTFDNIALFVSEHGLVAGLSDGTLVQLQQDKLHLDVIGKRASLAYREINSDLRQIIFSLTEI